MRPSSDGVALLPTTLAKQSRQDKPIEKFFFPLFPPNTLLCQVNTFRTYMNKTRPPRGEQTRLFVSFIKPHKAVMSSTIARWLRTIIEQAEIDTSIFEVHFIRGAST